MGIRRSDSVLRAARGVAAVATCLALANCASSNKFASRVDPKYGVSSSPRVVALGDPVPKGGGTYRIGKPYVVGGRTYVPEEDVNYRAEGMASWYGDDFHGRLTANGEVFDMGSLTAAHPTLPMPSYARVTNISNGKSLVVRVNDRGPYHGNRLIDVSNKAAELLEFKGNGVAKVRVEYVGRAPLEGSDDRQLMATLRTGDSGAVALDGAGRLGEAVRARAAVVEPRRHPWRGSDAGGAALQSRQHLRRHGLAQCDLGDVGLEPQPGPGAPERARRVL